MLLPFSRKHESEADYIGILLAADAATTRASRSHLWERMEQMSGGKEPSEFLSTHPGHETRIEQLKKWMPEASGHLPDQMRRYLPALLPPPPGRLNAFVVSSLKVLSSGPIVFWREGEDRVIAWSGNALRGKSGLHGQGAG